MKTPSEAESVHKMEDEVEIIEIGPREGLQNHPEYIDVKNKVALIDSLFDAGFRAVEVASFVHPKIMPQMRDGVDILRGIGKRPGRSAQVLVPNETGCRNAIACEADEVVVWTYPTDELNYLTLNRDISMTFKEITAVLEIARSAGTPVSAWIGGSFGYPGMSACFWQDVRDMVRRLIELGCSEVCLSDEFCMANPRVIRENLALFLEDVDPSKLLVHFHDNRGLGFANSLAAYDQGIRKFKSCIGGAGLHTDLSTSTATGLQRKVFPSVPTEDLVYGLEEMNIHTGLDVSKIIECGRIAEKLLGKRLNSWVIANHISESDYISPQERKKEEKRRG
jgi:hydroxymethylglutaryl-CoA lyase